MRDNPECATVLLVDDDPSHLKLYSWIVARRGYRAITALVGSAGVSLPRGVAPQVAVMDYRYSSELSAVDVHRIIKAAYPNIPIILISEVIWPPDEMKDRVNGFVIKGDPDALLDMIEALCGQSPRSSKNA